MRKCSVPGCGKTYRKGTIAFVLVPGSGLKSMTACPDCVSGGVLLIAPKVAEVADVGKAEKAERKSQREHLAPFVKLFEGRVRALKAAGHSRMVSDEAIAKYEAEMETLEGVVYALKEGRT